MKARLLPYLIVFAALLAALSMLPKEGGYIWQPEVINVTVASLFTLLVYLVARIAGTHRTTVGITGTALFTLLFCPGSDSFFLRDEVAVMELISISIVPFFMSQYTRISTKDFRYGYFLMLLMGIFCSYTHDGITIPLCLGFATLAYQQRTRFFRTACWPMVIGFAIGTTLSLTYSSSITPSSLADIEHLSTQTATGFRLLWDTKVFFFGTLLTIYYLGARRRRKRLNRIFHEQSLMTYCLLYAVCTVPFAPLGLDNAVSGVCFFCMFWVLFLAHDLLKAMRNRTITATPVDSIPNGG